MVGGATLTPGWAGRRAARCAIGSGGVWLATAAGSPSPPKRPKRRQVLDVQAGMPFQILIPAYLPKGFDRAGMEIDVNSSRPGRRADGAAHLPHRARARPSSSASGCRSTPTRRSSPASRPIETKWGPGWMLRQGRGPAGHLGGRRPAAGLDLYPRSEADLPAETLLAIAETLGPASNRQVFNFVVNPPEVREVEPPPPVGDPDQRRGRPGGGPDRHPGRLLAAALLGQEGTCRCG